ncbi:hypothetical protein AC482_03025 [miscellaneous Crenarchaeota group-15 archaeon DG-45]|uniref:DNA repair and recombination protein RadB n=1 Tax=miscellaneous Crenarchaeota group-15 archaeon DG-45 TaxID=1685127 RepID=A0A0M0BRB8_9ARCH|nr:MAG: hypothetical protein AC482_03025 [miscellaneous Crenarchaeota group-15 archaeon DG-45]
MELDLGTGRLSTGCDALDGILGGGFRFGGVSLIYGEASTGKTTIALSCVINHLRAEPGSRAFYIDADDGLSTPRLTQIAGIDGGPLLERLLIWRPRCFTEQTEIVEGLPAFRASGAWLVVVDSITGLYRLEAGDAERTFTVNKELNWQLGLLSETAKTGDAAVLLAGQVHSVIDSAAPQVEPVAQRLLRYWSDTVLRLETTHRAGVRQAALEKPGEGRGTCRFGITDRGLTDVNGRW